MKARLKKSLAWLALMFTFIPTSWAGDTWCFSPHIGIDYKHWGMDGKVSPSFERMFPEVNAAGALYIGTRINKFFGIDFGYERSTTEDKWYTFEETTNFFGSTSNVNDRTHIKTNMQAWYLSGLFYWEMIPHLELVLHAGLVSLHPKSSIMYYPAGQPLPLEFSFKTKSKWAGRFGLGVQYLFLCHFGARAIMTWDQTSRINYVGRDHNQSYLDIKPYKNALSFNLGLFAEF